MNIVITIVVVILQLVVGQTLGFGGALALGVGEGLELVVFVIGSVLGVWGVGAAAARLRGQFQSSEMVARLIGAVVGSALGVGILLITPPMGFVKALLPLIGALVGYYAAAMIRR